MGSYTMYLNSSLFSYYTFCFVNKGLFYSWCTQILITADKTQKQVAPKRIIQQAKHLKGAKLWENGRNFISDDDNTALHS